MKSRSAAKCYLLCFFRQFHITNKIGTFPLTLTNYEESDWPNLNLGRLERVLKRCPLPGNVGLEPNLETRLKMRNDPKGFLQNFFKEIANTGTFVTVSRTYALRKTNYEEQVDTMRTANLIKLCKDSADDVCSDVVNTIADAMQPFIHEELQLECVVYPLPLVLHKDLCDIFPDKQLDAEILNVVLLSHRTTHDMSVLSEEMLEERKRLRKLFVQNGIKLVQFIREKGFWADFLDPHSSTPFFGVNKKVGDTSTDERTRMFEVTLEDFDCCKVIRHRKWGTHTFVGVLFCDVPAADPLIEKLSLLNSRKELSTVFRD